MTTQADLEPQMPPMQPWANVLQSQTKSGEILHLVRLSAIVQWLMAAKRKYFKHAILEMCQSLSGFKGLRMYLDYGNGDAREVSQWDFFGLKEVKYRHEYYWTPLPDGVTGGISAALYYMEKVWGEGKNLGPRKNKEDWLGLLYYENDIDGNHDPRDSYTGAEKPEMLLSIPAEQAATIFGTVADVVPLHAVVATMTNAEQVTTVAEQAASKPDATTPEIAPLHAASTVIANAVLVPTVDVPSKNDKKPLPRKWTDVEGLMEYVVEFYKAGKYSKSPELYKALVDNAGESSKFFDKKGTVLFCKGTKSCLTHGNFRHQWKNIRESC